MSWNPPLTLATLLLLLPACVGTLRDRPPAVDLETFAVESSQNYVVGPSDFLRVTVWQQPNLSQDSVVVRPDGKISLPLLNDVHVAGMTTLEIKDVISERLSEYVMDPEVTVIVLQVNSKAIFVLGEVARQGPIQLNQNMRIVDALSMAGGFSSFADKTRVKLIRDSEGGEPREFVFNYDSFVSGRDLAQDLLLVPGDRIVIPEDRLGVPLP
ncbi:MAG: polysaccharide biosynthesis/export family protein [Myxococcota bacterium]